MAILGMGKISNMSKTHRCKGRCSLQALITTACMRDNVVIISRMKAKEALSAIKILRLFSTIFNKDKFHSNKPKNKLLKVNFA